MQPFKYSSLCWPPTIELPYFITNLATVLNHDINIWKADYLICDHQRSHKPQVANRCLEHEPVGNITLQFCDCYAFEIKKENKGTWEDPRDHHTCQSFVPGMVLEEKQLTESICVGLNLVTNSTIVSSGHNALLRGTGCGSVRKYWFHLVSPFSPQLFFVNHSIWVQITVGDSCLKKSREFSILVIKLRLYVLELHIVDVFGSWEKEIRSH